MSNFEMFPIEKIVKRIQQNTDSNDHFGAVMELAIFLKNKTSQKILQSLIDLQNAYGHSPNPLIQLRSMELDKLLQQTVRDYNQKTADQIKSAF